MNTEVESGTVEPTVPAQGAPETDAHGSADSVVATNDLQSWEELGVKPELKQTLLEMGFLEPMAVQRAVFPRMMAGKDVHGAVAHRLRQDGRVRHSVRAGADRRARRKEVQALCLAPTRELALQVAQRVRADRQAPRAAS